MMLMEISSINTIYYTTNIINELDNEDFIYQGKYRSKSVYITEKGVEEAKKLLKKYKIKDY